MIIIKADDTQVTITVSYRQARAGVRAMGWVLITLATVTAALTALVHALGWW